MAMNETDNSSCLEKYDLKSGSQECIFSDGKSYITNLFKSENGVFFSADDDEGNIKIMEVTDNDVYALDAFEEVKISNVFCGDDQYDFYFESGSTIFGYNSKEDSGTRIIDLVDSGLIYRIDSFSKISEDCYFCLMTTDYDNIYLKLQKATDAENARFNNRKKIIIAGVNIKENTPLTEAVLQFNNENMDYYISVRDYSVKDKLLGSLEYDVIKSEVPDIYVFDQNFDVRALSNKNALCNLKEFMENDSDLNIDDLIGPVLNSTSDNDGVYGILTSFKLVGVVKENTDGEAFECESYSDFLKSLVDEKIYFKHAKETALWDYLVLSRANEFIDYKNNKCNFDADIFSNILKFIPDAINLEGTAGIHDINDFISLSCLSALYESNYDIIDVSCDLGNSFGFAVSSASDNKEVSWIFIKKFLTEDYQNQVQDFPVLRTSFQNKYTEAVKLNGRSASIYTPDASEPVSFTINVSDKEMKAILELIESVPYINSVDPRVKDILKEGIYSYTEKELTAEEVAKSIQNKVNLYLNEIAG
ncbi:MAG: hypothetical protein IKH71_05720 [Oscillospiraceae bacterium]|nr:hypothetical protein [Oscillospiraceae bacterium]